MAYMISQQWYGGTDEIFYLFMNLKRGEVSLYRDYYVIKDDDSVGLIKITGIDNLKGIINTVEGSKNG